MSATVLSLRKGSDDIEVRSARHEDFESFARLFATIPGTLGPPRRAAWEGGMAALTMIAAIKDQVVGFTMFKIAGRRVLLHLVAVDERLRGQGVASLLFDAVRARLIEAGCVEARCNIQVENEAALSVARRFGGKELYQSALVALPWSRLSHLPAPPFDVEVRSIAPEDDARVEAMFDLWPGTLAGTRRSSGGAALGAFEARAVDTLMVGLACVDPMREGVFPLEVLHAGCAQPLLAAVRERIDGDELLLFVRRQPDFLKTLLAIGGERRSVSAHIRVLLGES